MNIFTFLSGNCLWVEAKKTREAIFTAFTSLLAEKNYNQISVQEIIGAADVGRTTFYTHFETKDYLVNHVTSSFVETVSWWLSHDMKESPEQITEYFLATIEPIL